MINKLMGVLLTAAFLVSGCQTMETATEKMEGVDKAVSNADAKFRDKVGLAPYDADKDKAASEDK